MSLATLIPSAVPELLGFDNVVLTPHCSDEQCDYPLTVTDKPPAAGCREEARAEIAQGMAAASERHARGRWAAWLRLEDEMLAVDDPAGACERLEEALALATELGMRLEGAHCHLELGKLYRRTGQRQDTREHIRLATTMYRELGMSFRLEKAEAELERPHGNSP